MIICKAMVEAQIYKNVASITGTNYCPDYYPPSWLGLLQVIRSGVLMSTMQSNPWAAKKYSNTHIWLFTLVCAVLSLSSLQITLALCLLLNFCTI